MGGFECATQCRRDGTRVDVLQGTGHDRHCAEDYRLLAEAGIHTVRDGLRWHLIERTPGVYDWSSFLPMLHAANATHTQVLWDLCHWGVPVGLDPFSDEFPQRFAEFSGAAARLIRHENMRFGNAAPQMYCPINEISYWTWVGGEVEHFFPYGTHRGAELKLQFVRASLAAMRAVRVEDPTARFVLVEPAIHVSPSADRPDDDQNAHQQTASQFEVWDMLAGRVATDLGGCDDLLDVLGINYYWNNEWAYEGVFTPLGHLQHKPLHEMLYALWQRYDRPIVITETGTEADSMIGWLGYVGAEVRQVRRMGVPVLGICIYPVMDYPGWDDERHCACGLIEVAADWSHRRLRENVRAELLVQQRLLTHNTSSISLTTD